MLVVCVSERKMGGQGGSSLVGCFPTDSLIVKIENNRRIFIVIAKISPYQQPCILFSRKFYVFILNAFSNAECLLEYSVSFDI